MRSHVWMTIGLAAGLVLGLVAAATRLPALLAAAASLRPLGTLFLNLLSMVVIPLVVTALFAGVAGPGSMRHVGRLGIRTLGFFWATTLAAIVIGFVVAALFLPLAGVTPDQQAALRSEEHTSELQSLAYLVCRLLLEKKKKRYSIECNSRARQSN